jgi:hypothetical protein
MKWQTLVSLTNSPIRTIALPAALIVPFLAAAFEYARVIECGGLACGIFRSMVREQYAPLWFWYYISSLCFAAFVLVVEFAAPETVKRHRDLTQYMDDVVRSYERANATLGERSWSPERVEAELRRYREVWSETIRSRPIMRTVASAFFATSVFIVLFGTFVYVPARVLSYDDLWRLFKSYFLLAS